MQLTKEATEKIKAARAVVDLAVKEKRSEVQLKCVRVCVSVCTVYHIWYGYYVCFTRNCLLIAEIQ